MPKMWKRGATRLFLPKLRAMYPPTFSFTAALEGKKNKKKKKIMVGHP